MNKHAKLLLMVVMLLQLQWINAQNNYQLQLDRAGIDEGTETIELANGHILVAGITQNGVSATSGQDGFLMEIDPSDQTIIWTKAYHVGAVEQLETVIQASNGDIIAGGNVTISGTTTEKWFLRVDAQGQLLNSTTFGRDTRTSITQIVESVTPDNGQTTYIVTGPTNNYNDVYGARVREDGSLVWLNEYTDVGSWTYNAAEASNGTIYLGGASDGETNLYVLTLAADGSVLSSDNYDNTENVAGLIRRMFLVDDNTLAIVGESAIQGRASNSARPYFMLINLATKTVPVARYYNTPVNFYTFVTDITPTYQGGTQDGYLLLLGQLASGGRTMFIKIDLTGQILNYYSSSSTTQFGKVQALADESTFIHLTNNNGLVHINRHPIDGASSCLDSLTLTLNNINTTSETQTATLVSFSPVINSPVTLTTDLAWTENTQCCISGVLASCCPDTLLTMSKDTAICLGETVDLTAGTTIDGTNVVYSWSTGATTATISVAPITTTTYTVIVRDTLIGCVDSTQVTVTVWADLEGANLTAVSDTCSNTLIELVAVPSGAANYDWSTGLLNNWHTQQVVTNFGNNVYNVEITDRNGCTATVSTVVEGLSCCQVTINSNDYVQLDPDNPDSRLADYGIVRFNNTRLYIMNNGGYNRMPARMRFAENVILYVRTAANSPTPTTMDITNTDLVFNHNAGIVVETASKIIGNNAVLRPCDERETWGGIRLEGRGVRPVSTGVHYVETNISLRECTFVNADFAISMHHIIEGTITGNLFQNCRHGIAAIGLDYQVAITNNTFKIDDKAINLTYNAMLRGNPWFHTSYFINMVNRYSLEHVGIGYYTSNGGVGVSNSIISQNNFINGLTLNLDSQLRFNGVVLQSVGTIDVAGNKFLNNDMGVVTHHSRLISVENNLFEVTRRSAVDENFYQVVNFAPNNSNPSPNGTILIKGNVFRNSADVARLSPVYGIDNASYLTEGSGAIYNFGGVGGAVKIIENDISGFQIGIYTEQGKVDLITNNKIKSDVYGIYAQRSDGLFGCNEITMDLEANVVGEGGVVGIRMTPDAGTVVLPTYIFGNCIKNTNRAVFFSRLPTEVNTNYRSLKHARVENNYLFNYTEAGLFVQNYNNAPSQADLVRRNAFISNQENGIGAVGTGVFDIMTSNSGTTNNTLTVGDNYYGSDNMANVLAFDTDPSNGTALTAITVGGTGAKPFTACGGMDADITTLTANEQDWLTRCGNENFTGNIIISQRTATTGVILTANYSTILTKIGAEDLEQAANLVTAHMHWLSNDLEVQQLYNSAQQLPLNNQQRQWLDAAYYSRLENWTAAKQALNNIMVDASEEARLTIAKATVEVAQQATLQDATLIAALKEVASELGAYRHEARELLNTYTNEVYEFSYNPVEVYTKTTKTTNSLQATSTNSMRLLPNPATTTIQVQLMDKKANWTTAELYDIHGRLIQSQTIRSYSLQFDVRELTPSVYFITLKTANGEQTTEKFVKQ